MSEASSTNHISCPNCGGIVSVDSKFCKHCAFHLAQSTEPSPLAGSAGVQSSSKSKYLLIAGGLIVTLALLLAALYIYKKRQQAAPLTSAVSQTMGDRAKQLEGRILQGGALTVADISGLSAYELRVLRNVHFARHGRGYDRPGLGDYFYTCPWYQPSAAYNDNLLTATDKANINLILPEENRVKAAEAASVVSTPALSTSVIASLFSNSDLTTDKVQRAVDQLLDFTKKGGTARVLGIQELPQQNMAKVDIKFEEFQYNSTDLGIPVSKNQAPPRQPDRNSPDFWQDLYKASTQQVSVRSYSGEGIGILVHYNDGRWVLTKVQLNSVGVDGNIQIQ